LAKEEAMRFNGIVVEELGNAMFKVKLNDSEHTVTAYIGGKMRKHSIKIIAGDSVVLEMSPYDLNKARIMYRNK
jgi:translation initiation factor IF-1